MKGIAYFKKIPEVLLSRHEEILVCDRLNYKSQCFSSWVHPFLGLSTKRERGRENPGTRPHNIIDFTKKKAILMLTLKLFNPYLVQPFLVFIEVYNTLKKKRFVHTFSLTIYSDRQLITIC